MCYDARSKSVTAITAIPNPIFTEPKGVVYTKRWVVELLLDLAGYRPEANLVDAKAVEPAAGCGAFLGPMIERLIASCEIHGRNLADAKKSLLAYELDHDSARRARDLLKTVLLQHRIEASFAESLAQCWVRTGDYLLEDWSSKADFVIGNPPYVRLEDMPEQQAAVYRQAYGTMRGRADLYVAFFEAALRQLNPGGVCAFICADRWMRNQYGAELRRLITSGFGVDFVIEMHEADAFHDEVDAYPAITTIRRCSQGPAVVAAATPEAERVPADELAGALRAVAKQAYVSMPLGLSAARVETWFKGDGPWPCKSPAQLALLRRLEEQFRPLESAGGQTRVGIGVATGNDKVFITRDNTLVEPSRLLKLALADDIRSGKLEWSGHYLVDPWDERGLVDLALFPLLRSYFERHAGPIKRRNVASRNRHGWYRTIDRVNHAVTAQPKLYIADIKSRLDPVLDTGETYPHHNLYFIQSSEWNLEVLGGLLMSVVGQFFVASYGVRMRGGYLRFQAQYLRRIRVPDPKAISSEHENELKQAFGDRDRSRATRVALEIYKISRQEMGALGH